MSDCQSAHLSTQHKALNASPSKRRTLAKAAFSLLAVLFLLAPLAARAQTDEIQVYDATIAPPGTFNLMLHTNFTPEGRTTPAYPGAIIANHSFNGGLEWAYGVTPWLEQGLYMPIYTAYSSKRGGSIDGFKVRELFVRRSRRTLLRRRPIWS